MIPNEREAFALAKLLKIARMNADEASRRIAELEAAHKEAVASLRFLAEAVSNEEAAAKAAEIVGFAQLSGFLAGAARKRSALEATKAQIEREIEAARADLDQTFSEMKKLEHLSERARQIAERRLRRAETRDMDDAAIARFVRKSGR